VISVNDSIELTMPDSLRDRYWIVARDKPGLLRAMMSALAGDAHISFEGDLSRCQIPASLSPSPAELPTLQRQTLVPRQDYVVLPLEPETIQPILSMVLPGNRFMTDIIHIQIDKSGTRQFGCYDNFHPECIVCYSGVPVRLLDDLLRKGVIRSWTVPPADAPI
jgi:hypothetical protein